MRVDGDRMRVDGDRMRVDGDRTQFDGGNMRIVIQKNALSAHECRDEQRQWVIRAHSPCDLCLVVHLIKWKNSKLRNCLPFLSARRLFWIRKMIVRVFHRLFYFFFLLMFEPIYPLIILRRQVVRKMREHGYPVMECRKHYAISGGGGLHDEYEKWCFRWMSPLMTTCCDDVLLLCGDFITRNVWVSRVRVWIRWWNVANIMQSRGCCVIHYDDYEYQCFRWM